MVANIRQTKEIRCQSPKYENGFKHLWHLAMGRAMNTNDEILWFFYSAKSLSSNRDM